MKFLTPAPHGLGDYAAAIVLIAAPFFLGIREQSVIAHWVSIASGIGLIIYSLLTNYPYSVAKVISFKAHLVLDVLAGLVLIAMAFILGLQGVAQIYMIVMGAGVLLVVAVTRTEEVSAIN
ncbi:MAG: hypothetical protein OER80_09155 [Gammaproteobacteria bacterium]|nr:hypothetical protein [Gammaproteobacteria bacterium]MDH3768607.1 hypothetical protein [Gammaproteobacteria bacterium]